MHGIPFEAPSFLLTVHYFGLSRMWIFNNTKDKTSALIRLAKWGEKVRQAAFKSFNTISRTMSIHYRNTLNYFDNRSTNASAESFNAKIKAFRAQFRGVRNVEFFLYRLTTIFA